MFVFVNNVCIQWKANLVSLSRVAAGQSLTVNQLVDMEWKFGGIYLPPHTLFYMVHTII